MAKANLPVNFKDDILKENMNGKRRFNMIQNSDGTVSFEDVTEYTQVGSTFGAAQINATNEAVNNAADASKIIDSLETIKANTQSGYIAGALAVKALNSNLGNINDYGLPFCIQSISMSHNASSDDTRHTYAPVTITIKWLRDCTVSGVTYSGSTTQPGGGLTLGDINGFHAKDSTTSFTGSVDSAYSAGSCGITYDYSNATITY